LEHRAWSRELLSILQFNDLKLFGLKTLWHISRILLGLVFMFSGFVKGIDPWGSAYKFTDYFNAWDLDVLTSLAFPLGILLSAFEFMIGLALTLNVFTTLFSIAALVFMAFFTGLTLIIVIYNPVTDCGCFGDALKLTNWQTFIKNIFLLAFALLVFKYRKRVQSSTQSIVRIVFLAITMFAFAYLAGYSFHHLPIIDFLPYKVGTNIPQAMTVPENAPKDVYENIFYYKNRKTGEEKKFTEQNYPWQDSLNWEFVSMDSKRIQKGYEPSIQNFTIETAKGDDVKDFFLQDPGYTFIFVVYDQGKADLSGMQTVQALSEYAQSNRMNFIGLTSAETSQTEQFKNVNKLGFDFFNADQTTLKTMVRSNPGLLLIKGGVILDKWHFNDFPSLEELQHELEFFGKRTPETK